MARDDTETLSRFLSLVLRHRPEAIGLELDGQGWASIDDLVRMGRAAGRHFDREDLLHVVATSDKKRFSLSPDGRSIRAAQGHSIPVDLGLAPQRPPARLYHGTAERFLDAILAEGLRPRGRQQVHLSTDPDTATRVGRRRGRPVVLIVRAEEMHGRGFAFFVAENGVWLTDHVPPAFLTRASHDTSTPPSSSPRPEPTP